jgi:hypothetical protein
MKIFAHISSFSISNTIITVIQRYVYLTVTYHYLSLYVPYGVDNEKRDVSVGLTVDNSLQPNRSTFIAIALCHVRGFHLI